MPAPLVLAHRGANRLAPENTLEAFAIALALGADGVELDVHASSDGVPMVHHASAARRVGALARHSFGTIRAARPDIPTLAEALDTCAGALVNVEVKASPVGTGAGEHAASLVVELLAARGGGDVVVVSCFDMAVVDHVRRLDARLATAVLTRWSRGPLGAVEQVAAHGHGLHPHVRALRAADGHDLMRRARQVGVAVRPWTVNDAGTVAALASFGVDAVLTDVPEVALSALGRARSG